MNKVDLLKEKAQIFRQILERHTDDRDVDLWLRTLTPLFSDIDDGKIVPPKNFEFYLMLGKDHPFYEPDSIYSHAYSEFTCALEDWASQPWYAEVEARSKASRGGG